MAQHSADDATDRKALPGILDGLRVLDFGRYVAGPFCAALLADLGAEVIRIDRVGGSEDRLVMPTGEEGIGSLFLHVNRNKLSMTLAPQKDGGRKVLEQLVATSDVVVANMPQRTLEQMGIDYESLKAIKPDIILTSVSAFGNGGPSSNRLGFDGIGQAMSGAAYLSGYVDQPVKAYVPYVDYSTAMCCAFGTLAALMARAQSGQGQIVEGSLLATALTIINPTLIEQALAGVDRTATLNRSQISGPSDIFRTSDGWIIVQVIGQTIFERWARLVGAEDLIGDPRFANDDLRGENGEELSRTMSEWCRTRTRAEALDLLSNAKIPAGPVSSPQEALDDEHSRQAGFFSPMDYPGLSKPAPVVAAPVRLSRTPGRLHRRAPTVGEHTDMILRGLGFDDAAIRELRDAGTV